MRERQAPRVERLAGELLEQGAKFRIAGVQPARLAVRRIADNRPATGRQVDANLVHASRDQATAEERERSATRTDARKALEARET